MNLSEKQINALFPIAIGVFMAGTCLAMLLLIWFAPFTDPISPVLHLTLQCLFSLVLVPAVALGFCMAVHGVNEFTE